MAMKPVTGKLRKGGGKGLSGDALVGRVSQSTINDIKRMGMTKALALAGKNGKTSGGMAREFQEGVRRMYGAKRLEAAKSKYASPAAKSADAARSKAMGANKVVTKPAPKPAAKNNTKANLLKGVGAAVGVGLAIKGGPAGRKAATKLAPGLMKTLGKSTIGKALVGGEVKMSPGMLAKAKAATKAAPAKVTVGAKGSFGPTTKTLAKSKLGTASEYATKAGQSQARSAIAAKSPDAARAAASTVSKKKVAAAGAAASSSAKTGKK